MKLRDCTEAELRAFVAAYPRRLEFDVYRAGDPPYCTYNDFTLGNWPDSVVASYVAAYDAETPAHGWKVADAGATPGPTK